MKNFKMEGVNLMVKSSRLPDPMLRGRNHHGLDAVHVTGFNVVIVSTVQTTCSFSHQFSSLLIFRCKREEGKKKKIALVSELTKLRISVGKQLTAVKDEKLV